MENPYEQMNDLGGKNPLFLVQHPCLSCRYLTPLAAFLWWHGFTDDFYRRGEPAGWDPSMGSTLGRNV